MALFRRLFYRKPPDRLLEIADRVYVFDCCFSAETMDQFEYKNYLDGIVLQLREQFSDSSLMVINFRDERQSQVPGLFSLYNIAVTDYPCQYLGFPLLPLDIILHFLKLSERWLMLEGQQNIVLMHCENGGWPVLAFMLAGLLLYRRQYNGEQRTLEMVYKQAPKELLQMLTTLNPQPSHLRYLQYIDSMDNGVELPAQPIPFTLDCIILREVPNFDGIGGCQPIVRVYGQDPLTPADKSCNILFSTPKAKKHARCYRKADNVPVKLNVGSCVQGDVIVECLHVDDGPEDETLMFRVMFNTFFIQSHILVLKFEEIDVAWDADNQFTRNFKAEVLFSEFDAESNTSTEVVSNDDEMEVASTEEFFEAEEIFSNPDSQEGQKDSDSLYAAFVNAVEFGTPRADFRKISPFANFEQDIDIDRLQDRVGGMSLSSETLKPENSCTHTEVNDMPENRPKVVNSSFGSTTYGDRDSSNSDSATYRDKEDGCTLEINSSSHDTGVDSNKDSNHPDSVLVKEVIIAEVNSPKDIQMVKEVIISEVTTSKQVLERDIMSIESGDATCNLESIALAEADEKETLQIVLKQDQRSLREDHVVYDNDIITKQEGNCENIAKTSISEINVLVPEPTDQNDKVEFPLSADPHPGKTTSSDSLSVEKNTNDLDACNTNGTAEQREEREASISIFRSQFSNVSSVNMLPEGSRFPGKDALTFTNANAVMTDSSRSLQKRKSFLPLSRYNLFAPSSPRRNLLRSSSTDLSFLSPLQIESKQHSVPSSSGGDALASSSVPPPPPFPTSLRLSSKVSSQVHPPLQPLRTVSSLPSLSFEVYLEISTTSTLHAEHEQHVNPHLPALPLPQQFFSAKTQEKDLHQSGSSFLPLPTSNSYAPHPPPPPPLPPPPSLPHAPHTQNNSITLTSKHEERRFGGTCSTSSPTCRQIVVDSGGSSLTSPSKNDIDTIECLLAVSNLIDAQVASTPNILTGMDVPISTEVTKSFLCMTSHSSSPKPFEHVTPPPPPPPPLQLPLRNSSDYLYKEPKIPLEQYPSSSTTSVKVHEAIEVTLWKSPSIVGLSSSQHLECRTQHISTSNEVIALIPLPPLPTTPIYSPSLITHDSSSSKIVEKVPQEQPLAQTTSKDIKPSTPSKGHGGIPIPPPPPPLDSWHKGTSLLPFLIGCKKSLSLLSPSPPPSLPLYKDHVWTPLPTQGHVPIPPPLPPSSLRGHVATLPPTLLELPLSSGHLFSARPPPLVPPLPSSPPPPYHGGHVATPTPLPPSTILREYTIVPPPSPFPTILKEHTTASLPSPLPPLSKENTTTPPPPPPSPPPPMPFLREHIISPPPPPLPPLSFPREHITSPSPLPLSLIGEYTTAPTPPSPPKERKTIFPHHPPSLTTHVASPPPPLPSFGGHVTPSPPPLFSFSGEIAPPSTPPPHFSRDLAISLPPSFFEEYVLVPRSLLGGIAIVPPPSSPPDESRGIPPPPPIGGLGGTPPPLSLVGFQGETPPPPGEYRRAPPISPLPPPPPPGGMGGILLPLPSIGGHGGTPPPPLRDTGGIMPLPLIRGHGGTLLSPSFGVSGGIPPPPSCIGGYEEAPPPPPLEGTEKIITPPPPIRGYGGVPPPPPPPGGIGVIPSSPPLIGGHGGALPSPFLGVSREILPSPSSIRGYEGALLPPSPPTGIERIPPPPPPLIGGYGGVPPPPPPPGGTRGIPPPPPPSRETGRIPPPPPSIGVLGGTPPPPPPAGFRGGAPPPPPPPGGHGRTPPPPSPRGHGGPSPPSTLAPPIPPGMPGAPPPPPGGRSLPAPPSGRGHGLSRSMGPNPTIAARRSSLKPLHWVKVTRAMQGSLWAELQKQADANSHSEFDVNELESLFAIAPKTKGGSKSEGRGKSLGSKPDKVHLIDIRRANNTEIMLTKIKMPLSDMMNAALALDDSVLDADQLENLIKFCPTKEEMELLKNYSGDKENLGKCEQFFIELMKVPRVETKFRIFSFKIQFRSQIRDVRKSLQTVASTCEEVRGSEKLKEIMKKILFLGNTLNQGTARGQAVGFRLDSLLKLTETRATTSKMTLMHYLCKVLAEKSPQLLDFHEDLISLETSSKLQLKALAEEQQGIVKGLEKVEQELTASESDGPVSDVFRKTLKDFIDASSADVRSLSALYTEVGKSADALALYFGEDPARCPFEQVVSTLLNFVGLFRKAHEENIKQIELEKKKAQKEAEKEANQDRTPVKSRDGIVDKSPRSPFR